ncbi:MAG: TENA/THI-4 protein [Actinobacteria bacterium]|nr:TENA/THI-4 protein [Actinomycetota bacterium]
MSDVAQRLDAETKRFDLLEHPFYVAWSEGRLTRDDLSFYSQQYFRQVEAFPTWLSTLSGRIDLDEARSIVEENLADEVGDDHPGLWLAFAESLGVDADAVRGAAVEDETASCVGAFTDAAENNSVPFALGMLYGYESQTPAVAATKIEGLKKHYGIEGPGVEYFELHGELDIEHSSEMARAIDSVCSGDADLAEAATGARAGAAAIWRLLDGVARVRQVA